MAFQHRSRLIDPDYAQRHELVGPTLRTWGPVAGSQRFDAYCGGMGIVRAFAPATVAYPSIGAYRIEAASITDEFCVFRGEELFLDSSILLALYQRREMAAVIARMTQAAERAIAADDAIEVDASVLVFHNEGGGTWGHYLAQNLPRALLFLQHFPQGRIAVAASHRLPDSSWNALFRTYGIGLEQLVPLERERTYRFREVFIADFLWNFEASYIHPLAEDLLAGYRLPPAADGPAPRRLAILRAGQSRAIVNAEAFAAVLARHGITAVQLGTQPLARQIRAWEGAEFVLSALGSDLTNMVFGRAGAVVLPLTPCWFGDNFFYNLATVKKMAWHEVMCGRIGEEMQPRHASPFLVDTALLDATLGEVLG